VWCRDGACDGFYSATRERMHAASFGRGSVGCGRLETSRGYDVSRTRHSAYPARGTRKSREREIALLFRTQLLSRMKTIELPRAFPLRTLIVCFTIWLIATEILVFDQIKFDSRTRLLEQAARALHGPEVIVPNEPSHVPSGAKMQTL